MFVVCISRLAQMQLFPLSSVQKEIDKLKNSGAKIQKLSTVRGKILDRNDKILAIDRPTFWLNIDYQLSQYMDPNYLECRRLLAKKSDDPNALYNTNIEIQNKVEQVKEIMYMCAHFDNLSTSKEWTIPEIEQKIKYNNDKIWNVRKYCVWKNNYPNQTFEEAVPDPNVRLLMVYDFRTVEMKQSFSLFELETDDDVFTAQFEFMDIDGIEIVSKGKRFYPYDSIAAQTIGWVGGVPKDTTLFQDDEFMRYLSDEDCGRLDGVEYACEPILRGRRGEVYSDIDQQFVNRTDPSFGQDVKLTIDIELQQKIENFMASYVFEPNVGPGVAAVVIDVNSGDILSLISLPNYNNNRTRYDYATLLDPNNTLGHPLINRALNSNYPPGSVVKPLILVAGMEEGVITSDTPISCPAHDPEVGWPRCWIWKEDHSGHDIMWGANNNTARNAIKGSCNAYFSKLADMLDSSTIQRWLYGFGYGHKILGSPDISYPPDFSRSLRESPGIISSRVPVSSDLTLEEMTPIIQRDKKRFGIGQSNLRVTPLQAANSMATIARGGIYMNPRLFYDLVPPSEKINLNISQHTLDTVYDGMYAVVNERNGTAYKEFSPVLNSFKEQDLKIYGKTGSTEGPENAWFGGFAIDSIGRKIAFAVVVEGGMHGSRDAAPLAKDILQFSIEGGYIGKYKMNK